MFCDIIYVFNLGHFDVYFYALLFKSLDRQKCFSLPGLMVFMYLGALFSEMRNSY